MPGPFARLLVICSLAGFVVFGTVWVVGLFTGLTLRVNTEAFARDPGYANEERHVVTTWYVQTGAGGLAVARLRLNGPGSVPRMHGYSETPPRSIDWLTDRPPRDPADLWTLKRPAANSGWEWRRGPFFARRQYRQTVWSSPSVEDGPLLVKQVDEAAAGLPAAVPAALFALLPLRAAIRARRRSKWVEQGRCWNCGYDVRATPARCPECGAKPRVKPRKTSRTAPRPP